jgi:hypothetical protein
MKIMKIMRIGSALIGLALLQGFSPAHASVLVMDFQGNAIGSAPTTYTEDGIRLVSTGSATTLFNLGNPGPGYANSTSSANSISIDLLIWGYVPADLVRR